MRRYRVTRLVAILGGLAIACCTLPAHGAPPLSQHRIQAIIRHVFPDDQRRALCIADRESDGKPFHWSPAAQNGSNTGLFQIDRDTWDPARNPRALPIVGDVRWSRMHEAAYNARVARRIWRWDRARGRSAWVEWSTRGICGG